MRRNWHQSWSAIAMMLAVVLWFHGFATAVPGSATRPGAAETAAAKSVPVTDDEDVRIRYTRGHTAVLRMSNGEAHAIRSVLNVPHVLAFGDYVWNTVDVPQGRVWIRIDLARQMISVFRGGDEIGTALVIYGAKSKPTPVGIFRILEKSRYYYSHSYDAPMPYSLRLTTDGVALHASSVRTRFATHGCIGLPSEFARLLYAAASQGDEVEILPELPDRKV